MTDKIRHFLAVWEMKRIANTVAEVSDGEETVATITVDDLRALLASSSTASEPCGNCNGTGRMVRDPDIGTDQECFVCDGSGQVESIASVSAEAKPDDYSQQLWYALISTGLYDRMNDVTGGDREYRKLVQELVSVVDPILDAKFSTTPAQSIADTAGAWHTGTPPTKAGDYAEYIVAVRRKAVPDRVFVFSSNHANNYGADDLHNQDGDEYIADGWYTVGHDTSGEFDSLFMPMLEDGDEVLGWQALPKWDASPAIDAAPEKSQDELRGEIAYQLHTRNRFLDMPTTRAIVDSAFDAALSKNRIPGQNLKPAIDAAGASEGDVDGPAITADVHANAKRYQWLKNSNTTIEFDEGKTYPWFELDAAIDAAIAKENGDE